MNKAKTSKGVSVIQATLTPDERKYVALELINEMQGYKDSLDHDPGGVWKAIELGVDQCIEIVKRGMGGENN